MCKLYAIFYLVQGMPQFMNELDKPKHVVIVMDGNGRWAKSQGFQRRKGHLAGARTAKTIIKHASKIGIECLSLFAFSSENWLRPKKEVRFLLDLVITTLTNELKELHENNVKLVFTGSRDEFSASFCKALADAEALMKDNTGLILNVVLNYGGRWDIVQATQKLLKLCEENKLTSEALTPEIFESQLCLQGMPEPDLFIRTSGEYRISNFFLWQLAYAELYFTQTYWPDFTTEEFDKSLQWYCHRERRFGQTSEQLDSSEIAHV